MLTSTVGEAVENVAFITEALEAPGRVDAEMVAGAVKGALVDVCAQRDTHKQKISPNEEKWHIAVLFSIHRLLWLAEGYDAENNGF